ncbi:U4/U6-U5 tri-snRNP-associated protein 2 [Acrasis kona]|uniref:U4/U6-U5 tri-snRNP-associated protein 2 n=1 Tax=Acrasis kona TaxID=1008807 RepID=A0AAW2YHV8_9EUKA
MKREQHATQEPPAKKLKVEQTHDPNDPRYNCPYLDTINRKVLDFDFEKVCSITLSNSNVYGCLVCGKYFQGRGSNTPAYIHSLDENHQVFIHLANGRVWCLPDGYEVIDPSLEDIKYNLNPTYTDEQIKNIESNIKKRVSVTGTDFYPGLVGLNNIKETDGVNVVVQTLARIEPIRSFFLKSQNLSKVKSPVLFAFCELMRKMFNPISFKAQVSPHEFMQCVTVASNKRFKSGTATNPLDLWVWLINHMHLQLGGTTGASNNKQTIITQVFQGTLTVSTSVSVTRGIKQEQVIESSTQTIPFMFLTCDIPPVPLFKDEHAEKIVPQVSLVTLLHKYDGNTSTSVPTKTGDVQHKTYKINKWPQYLCLHMNRFGKNNFYQEKNSTIVKSLTNLEWDQRQFHMVSNICHVSNNEINDQDNTRGSYEVNVSVNHKWYNVADLHVKEVMAEEVTVSQSFLQFYKV